AYNAARAASPPSLYREGERVQPPWLHKFVRNPFEIRPMTVLRMPRFNMSEDDARALADYFAAVDKLSNPGVKITYPYAEVPQREKDYWLKKNAEYVQRLRSQKLLVEKKEIKDGKEVVVEKKEVEAYKDRLERMNDVWARITRDIGMPAAQK